MHAIGRCLGSNALRREAAAEACAAAAPSSGLGENNSPADSERRAYLLTAVTLHRSRRAAATLFDSQTTLSVGFAAAAANLIDIQVGAVRLAASAPNGPHWRRPFGGASAALRATQRAGKLFWASPKPEVALRIHFAAGALSLLFGASSASASASGRAWPGLCSARRGSAAPISAHRAPDRERKSGNNIGRVGASIRNGSSAPVAQCWRRASRLKIRLDSGKQLDPRQPFSRMRFKGNEQRSRPMADVVHCIERERGPLVDCC